MPAVGRPLHRHLNALLTRRRKKCIIWIWSNANCLLNRFSNAARLLRLKCPPQIALLTQFISVNKLLWCRIKAWKTPPLLVAFKRFVKNLCNFSQQRFICENAKRTTAVGNRKVIRSSSLEIVSIKYSGRLVKLLGKLFCRCGLAVGLCNLDEKYSSQADVVWRFACTSTRKTH